MIAGILVTVLICIWATAAAGMWLAIDEKATTLREFHHAYVGTALMLVALALRGGWLAWVCLVLGSLLTLDDAIEHVVMAAEGHPWSPIYTYVLPLLWRIPGVPALGRFLDRLFGKKAPAPPATP